MQLFGTRSVLFSETVLVAEKVDQSGKMVAGPGWGSLYIVAAVAELGDFAVVLDLDIPYIVAEADLLGNRSLEVHSYLSVAAVVILAANMKAAGIEDHQDERCWPRPNKRPNWNTCGQCEPLKQEIKGRMHYRSQEALKFRLTTVK